MDKLLKQKFIEELRQLQSRGDTEQVHAEADYVLCQILNHLGYQDIVREYERVPKWFS